MLKLSNVVKIIISREYEQLLKSMNWPFHARNATLSGPPTDDFKPKFQQLTRLLLESELPYVAVLFWIQVKIHDDYFYYFP